MLFRNYFILFTLIFVVGAIRSHGGDKHKKESPPVLELQVEEEEPAPVEPESSDDIVTWQEFPTLHPLVVHFPVVLFVVAPFFYALGMFTKRREYRVAGLLLCLGGIGGGLLAGYVFHPHTEGLTSELSETLETHELFADLSLVAAGLALLAGALEWRLQKVWSSVFCLALLFSATVFVGVAGHYGAVLTHIHGAGKYLEANH